MSKSTGCRIGYLYTNNSSKHTLSETLKLNLKGAEIFWPPTHEDTYELELPAGADHIAIFRATATQTSYSYLPSVKPRVKGLNELIDLANKQPHEPLGNTGLIYRLYNSVDAACLVIENTDASSVWFKFTFETVNLRLENAGEDWDMTFSSTVEPGQKSVAILRPIVLGESTSIGFSAEAK